MKNKTIKIIIAIILMLAIPYNVFAGYTGINTSVNGLNTIGSGTAAQTTKPKIEAMLGIFQVIGSGISVIALAIIGIRYMISSVEEKANMKGVLIYYVVGACLVFATSNLLGIVYDIIKGINY